MILSLSLRNSLALSELQLWGEKMTHVGQGYYTGTWTFPSSCRSQTLLMEQTPSLAGSGTLSAEAEQSPRFLFNFPSRIAMLAKLLCGNWPRLFLRFLPASKVYESKIIFRIWKCRSSWSHWKITTQESTMIAKETWLALFRSKPIRPTFKDILDWKFVSPLLPYVILPPSRLFINNEFLISRITLWMKAFCFLGSTLNLWISISIKVFFLLLDQINFYCSLICLPD